VVGRESWTSHDAIAHVFPRFTRAWCIPFEFWLVDWIVRVICDWPDWLFYLCSVLSDFHDQLNEQNADIQFTKEIEENGKLPFLDCLARRDNNELRTTVHRKPTHTDRLLDESWSYNPTVTQSHDYKDIDETSPTTLWHTRHLTWRKQIPWTCFLQKQLQRWLIRRNIYRTTEADATNRNPTPVTTVKGTSETISRILQPYNIRVAHNYVTTLADQRERQGRPQQQRGSSLQDQMLRLPGFLHWWDWQNPQHKTNWTQTSHEKWWCQQSHCCTSLHHQLTNHNIDWDSAQCLTYSTNYFRRLTLESWYTNLGQTHLNRCQQLPAPYKRLVQDGNETDKRTSNRPT